MIDQFHYLINHKVVNLQNRNLQTLLMKRETRQTYSEIPPMGLIVI